MSTMKATEKPLSLAELAERWGCSTETVLDRVRTRGVPFIWLGHGEPRLTTAGRKFVIFGRKSIEDWERDNERTWPPATAGPVEPKPSPIRGWDGVSRLGGRRERKPKPA